MPKLKYIKVKPVDFDILVFTAANNIIGDNSCLAAWIIDIVRQNRKFLHTSCINSIIKRIGNISIPDYAMREQWHELKRQLEALQKEEVHDAT